MILAVDTSTQWMSIALYDGAQVLGELSWQTCNHHTVELAKSIDLLLGHCGVAAEELSALAVAKGPGSFTSLRIGMAHVKGMALALRLPVIGVPTLDILAAAQAPSEMDMVVLLEAGRKRLAYALYEYHDGCWNPDGQAKLATAKELAEQIHEPVLVCGELSAATRETFRAVNKRARLLTPAHSLRRSAFLAEIAWKRFVKNDVDDAATLSPTYLHVANPIPG
ncbi:MAG: tRNA (adenosine(37)-N6)-threonylcarbamoyltransferase complex dimerization subunit type 1 TsaB [Anaerolineaceae bacterium]|nr:tRNA (adenosine(37)-N6)-threonylcarbamoyltransferase complex dimerization subunit type 1 TsaB [Anaerolineaceae bacterium]